MQIFESVISLNGCKTQITRACQVSAQIEYKPDNSERHLNVYSIFYPSYIYILSCSVDQDLNPSFYGYTNGRIFSHYCDFPFYTERVYSKENKLTQQTANSSVGVDLCREADTHSREMHLLQVSPFPSSAHFRMLQVILVLLQVLRIKPPMCVTKNDVHFGAQIIRKALENATVRK